MVVTVTADGPFKVTSHTTNAAQNGGVPINVTWDVAGTTGAAIDAQNVQILLSTNGGVSFDTVLANSVPNNGNATVTLPNENYSAARLMIKAVGNIFYAVNAANFSIVKTLATAETEIKTISIYPNPTQEFIYIKLPTQAGEFILYDASGRLLKSGKLERVTQVSVSEFTNGSYILSVSLDNGERVVEKIIIKKVKKRAANRSLFFTLFKVGFCNANTRRSH